MRFTLYHDREKKTLAIPAAIVKLAGFDGGETLRLHVEDGAAVLLREEMTAAGMVAAIERLSRLASDYTVKLALACGACDGCGGCAEDEDGIPKECEECGSWKDGCDSGVNIPACTLRDAGIDPEDAVEIYVKDGKVIVAAAEKEQDPLDAVPPVLLNTFALSGVCMESLRDLLESGEVVHE